VSLRENGAVGNRDMAGVAARVAVERCGKQPRYNAPCADGLDSVTGMLAHQGHAERRRQLPAPLQFLLGRDEIPYATGI
jgi:hypothetical protein